MPATDLSPNVDNYYIGQGIIYFRGADVPFTETGTIVNAGSFVIGSTYIIDSVGTTDFTLVGAADNVVGTQFTATGVGEGTGTAELMQKVWRDLGNVPTFEFSSSVERRDHFSSRTPTRMKDKSDVIGKSGSLRMVFEEWTAPNLAMVLLATQTGADETALLEIMNVAEIRGEIKFVGTNDIGPKWNFYFPQISFAPSGSLNPLTGGDHGQMEVTGEVLIHQNSFGKASRDVTLLPA